MNLRDWVLFAIFFRQFRVGNVAATEGRGEDLEREVAFTESRVGGRRDDLLERFRQRFGMLEVIVCREPQDVCRCSVRCLHTRGRRRCRRPCGSGFPTSVVAESRRRGRRGMSEARIAAMIPKPQPCGVVTPLISKLVVP